MSIEVATCKHCGHIVSKDYIKGRYQWHCDRCKRNVKPLWTGTPTQSTPMQTEPYEPMDGAEVSINISDFQERMNRSRWA